MLDSRAVDFLKANLDGVRRCGSEWTARCPAHDDHRTSLTFGPGNKRGLVANCKAKCTFVAIADACRLPSELRGNVLQVDHSYTYREADGTPSREVLRCTGKVFFQRSWDASGAVVWSVKGHAPLLYDLPEVIWAVARGDFVWVVEGERDAETLKGYGLIATTAPGGASVRWQPEIVEPLRGASHVAILLDCDKAGRDAARQRHQAISAVVDDVRFFDLAPGRDDGYDISDWFAGGHTVAELLRLAELALTAPPPESIETPRATEPCETTKSPRDFLKIDDDVLKRRDLTRCEKMAYSVIRRDVELSGDIKKHKGFRLDLSTRTIADRIGMARASVQSAINGLETKGFIITQLTNGGRQKRNSYEIVTPIPYPQMAQKLGHLAQAETPQAVLLNGPKIGPHMAQKLGPHINREAEITITQKENSSSISELEKQTEPEKNLEEIPAKNWPERLACGHALPWVDESGETCCIGCDPPPNFHVIAPTA